MPLCGDTLGAATLGGALRRGYNNANKEVVRQKSSILVYNSCPDKVVLPSTRNRVCPKKNHYRNGYKGLPE
eukprot:CAMPEP_0184690870 /NCGR_PEP_ID=MMETSP0312-20130426/31480_1 /TAXON_ID=31354 /ORGANISM="Compsopogon coeruleus, Strain SAG 36.94" /LENGTH=70 /DNA_ID=CAMNT_0027148439 /DNA_START=294 /DNA_END=506 /DNA_ORIENTATION=+